MNFIEKIYKFKKEFIKKIKAFLCNYFTVDGMYTSLLPDRTYIKMLYKKTVGKKLNLRTPKTFTEKCNWLKLYDHRPEYTVMVDKYKAKEYMAEKIGQQHLVPLLGVWDSPDEINFDLLPNEFVLKCNHDSEVVICTDKEKNEFKCKKGKINSVDDVKSYLGKRIGINYYKASREWPYKNVPRKIICEKFMHPPKGEDIVDYKLMCFNGKVRLVAVYAERFNGRLKEDYYTTEWKHISILNKEEAGDIYKRPASLDEMVIIAEQLSKGIPFLRVDFNIWENMLAVGEMTFFHHGSMLPFCSEWETMLGDWIELPKEKYKAK